MRPSTLVRAPVLRRAPEHRRARLSCARVGDTRRAPAAERPQAAARSAVRAHTALRAIDTHACGLGGSDGGARDGGDGDGLRGDGGGECLFTALVQSIRPEAGGADESIEPVVCPPAPPAMAAPPLPSWLAQSMMVASMSTTAVVWAAAKSVGARAKDTVSAAMLAGTMVPTAAWRTAPQLSMTWAAVVTAVDGGRVGWLRNKRR
mmetsp:Transcript_404/g.1034  ORF Transcript_404/g.1034 Transcript_404/m.1034 type:complete len:205 (-) Transcript_404:333-947(-)